MHICVNFKKQRQKLNYFDIPKPDKGREKKWDFFSTQAFPSLTPQSKHKVLKQRERSSNIYIASKLTQTNYLPVRKG